MPANEFNKSAINEIEKWTLISTEGESFFLKDVSKITRNPNTGELKVTHGMTYKLHGISLEEILGTFERKGMHLIPSREVSSPAEIMQHGHDYVNEWHHYLNPTKHEIVRNNAAPKGFSLRTLSSIDFFFPVQDDFETPLTLEEIREQYILDENFDYEHEMLLA